MQLCKRSFRLIVCAVLAFVTGCGTPPPELPKIRVVGPPGTDLKYEESYVDVDGRSTSWENETWSLTIPESGVFEKDLETGHSGVRFQITTSVTKPVSLVLLDGEQVLDKQVSGSAQEVLVVQAGQVPERPPPIKIPGFIENEAEDSGSPTPSLDSGATEKPDAGSISAGPPMSPMTDAERVRVRSVIDRISQGSVDNLLASLQADIRSQVVRPLLAGYIAPFSKQHGRFVFDPEPEWEKLPGHGDQTFRFFAEIPFVTSGERPKTVPTECSFVFAGDQLVEFNVESDLRHNSWISKHTDIKPIVDLARQAVDAMLYDDVAGAYQQLSPFWRSIHCPTLEDFRSQTREGLQNFQPGVVSVDLLGTATLPEYVEDEHASLQMFFGVTLNDQTQRVVQIDAVFPGFAAELQNLDLVPSAYLLSDDTRSDQLVPRVRETLLAFAGADGRELFDELNAASQKTLDKAVIDAISRFNRTKARPLKPLAAEDVRADLGIRSGRINEVKAIVKPTFGDTTLEMELVFDGDRRLGGLLLEAGDPLRGFHAEIKTDALASWGEQFLDTMLSGESDGFKTSLSRFDTAAFRAIPPDEYSDDLIELLKRTGAMQKIVFRQRRDLHSPLVMLSYDVELERFRMRAEVTVGFDNWQIKPVDVLLEPIGGALDPAKRAGFSSSKWYHCDEAKVAHLFSAIQSGATDRITREFHPTVAKLLGDDSAAEQLQTFSAAVGPFVAFTADTQTVTGADGDFTSHGTFEFQKGSAQGKLIFANDRLLGLSLQSQEASVDTFGLSTVPPEMVQAGRQFLEHCLRCDGKAAYAMLSPELKERADLERVQAILPQEPVVTNAIDFDAGYLDDHIHPIYHNIPVNVKLYYRFVFADQSEQFARVEYATSSNSITGFRFDADDYPRPPQGKP